MDKLTFLSQLKAQLGGLPPEDVRSTLDYYAEMIDDRVEDGMSEDEAVADLGEMEEIVRQSIQATPLTKLITQSVKPRRTMRGWEIALLIVGSPIWASLLIAFAAVALSLYIVLWALVIVIFAVAVSFGAAALGCLAGALFAVRSIPPGIWAGAALIFAGLAVLVFLLGLQSVRLAARGTKNLTLSVKKALRRKEARS